jgi:hypothetical protein
LVINISNSEEEADIGPPIVEKHLQLVSTSKPKEEGELQQPVVEEQP